MPEHWLHCNCAEAVKELYDLVKRRLERSLGDCQVYWDYDAEQALKKWEHLAGGSSWHQDGNENDGKTQTERPEADQS